MTTEQGGDPACWADRVCEQCGQIVEDEEHRCPRPAEPEDGAT